MRLPACGLISVLLFGAMFWPNPGPWTQSAGSPFDPSGFRACAQLCRIEVETCQIECQMGGYPPGFNPAECMYFCNPSMAVCMDTCIGWPPLEVGPAP
jgi:hypothetical protein